VKAIPNDILAEKSYSGRKKLGWLESAYNFIEFFMQNQNCRPVYTAVKVLA
jgi:hypothetical protein